MFRFTAALFLSCNLLPVFVAAQTANIQTAPAPLTPQQSLSIDRFIAAEMQKERIPGLSLGIYSNGKTLLAKGYGLADVELSVPVKPETLFQSGSVGKQFVSAAIMMLVEDGKLSLDDSLAKFFPNAPAFWKPIKIKNLLSHTSGLAEYESDERTGPKGPFYLRLDFTEPQMIAKIQALPMEFAPGAKWDYRNTNYVLLGYIIEKITGKFYADFLHERIFQPLGMSSTRLISEADIIPNRSSGYELVPNKTTHQKELKNQTWVSPTFDSTADGALYYNVLDLAKWDAALYGTTLLKQSSLDRLWTVYPLNDGKPNPSNYGFGWEITQLNGHKLIEHDGAWQGFTCDISRYTDDTLTVVVLTNLDSDHSDPTLIAHVVAGLVNPALEVPKLEPIEDKQPELATSVSTLLDQLTANKVDLTRLTPKLARRVTSADGKEALSHLSGLWPNGTLVLVHREPKSGLTVSQYRLTKADKSLLITFGLNSKGLIDTLGLEPDHEYQ